MTNKELFKQRFEKLYEGKRLLAIQLNGFTHAVFYDDKAEGEPVGKYSVDHYSGCMGDTEAKSYGYNSEAVKQLFSGFANYEYQGNAEEIVYVRP